MSRGHGWVLWRCLARRCGDSGTAMRCARRRGRGLTAEERAGLILGTAILRRQSTVVHPCCRPSFSSAVCVSLSLRDCAHAFRSGHGFTHDTENIFPRRPSVMARDSVDGRSAISIVVGSWPRRGCCCPFACMAASWGSPGGRRAPGAWSISRTQSLACCGRSHQISSRSTASSVPSSQLAPARFVKSGAEFFFGGGNGDRRQIAGQRPPPLIDG